MALKTFTPLHNYLVVEKVDRETIINGIHLPDTAQKGAPLEGIVHSVGGGKTENGVLIPMTVALGNRIMFEEAEARPIKLNGVSFLLLSEDSVYGIMG